MIPKSDRGSSKGNNPKTGDSSSSSDHTDRDGSKLGQQENREEVRTVKDHHDSVVHEVVLDNKPDRLRELLEKGLFAKGKSIDGATPLHRAAEVGAIACAKILVEFGADVDAMNLAGETPFHVAALNK
eukprot:CAMPEP_0185569072 /NCGR_PEP_ID=MMETSP0434-20130131/1815_1 /TAXON_ID=626734 ORGANISM="Favella taraikaensis, Strain Fe Narragansett Bay" /NCGR_SAMPLE_ID=MMETSP0434 /ASSEMBLY_ACC=CAM_ASM_000379 /LENGTH=127 /DNA_ID=CAMNT_0028183751 /DNA_START=336 /DNA_END=719 /DNA_ORIENTATION=-